MNSIPKTSGIYKIICIANDKIYVGSTNNLRRRWNDHRSELRRNAHPNLHLQRAWNYYGEMTFKFEIIELVMPWSRIDRENYWLKTLKPFDQRIGFNCLPEAGEGAKGISPTIETREKISISQKRIWATPEGKMKKSESMKGHIVSKETRAKISASHKGVKLSPEHVEKSAAAHRGRRPSSEVIERAAAARRGLKRSLEFRIRLAERSSKSYIVTSPNGTETQIKNLSEFCRDNNLSIQGMSRVATGERKQYKGWRCRYA